MLPAWPKHYNYRLPHSASRDALVDADVLLVREDLRGRRAKQRGVPPRVPYVVSRRRRAFTMVKPERMRALAVSTGTASTVLI